MGKGRAMKTIFNLLGLLVVLALVGWPGDARAGGNARSELEVRGGAKAARVVPASKRTKKRGRLRRRPSSRRVLRMGKIIVKSKPPRPGAVYVLRRARDRRPTSRPLKRSTLEKLKQSVKEPPF